MHCPAPSRSPGHQVIPCDSSEANTEKEPLPAHGDWNRPTPARERSHHSGLCINAGPGVTARAYTSLPVTHSLVKLRNEPQLQHTRVFVAG